MSSPQRGKILALLLPTLIACHEPPAVPPSAVAWSAKLPELRARVLERIERDSLARSDGWRYTIDVAQLLEAAARLGDETLYDAVRPTALAARVDARENPFRRGFVAWRTHPDEPNDATGTTEALRLARALWLGAAAFGREEDRASALEILEGYARHAFVDQGVWLIRNYYNLQTDAFATNSFLVDYDLDFTLEVAAAEPRFDALAKNVRAVIRGAITDTGLVHELVQPEVLTALPYFGTATFSPNNRAQLSNSCAVLERALTREREAARSLLGFAHARAEDLGLIYDVSSGERHPRGRPGVETFGCLTRLAAALGTPELARSFDAKLAWYVRDFLHRAPEPFAFVASELLLTAATFTRRGP